MKKYFLILTFVYHLGSLNSQNADSIRSQIYYTEMLDTIEKYSLVSDSIKWPLFRKEIEFLASGHSKDTSFIVLNRILNELRLHGDFHSYWRSRKREREKSMMSDSFNYPKLNLLEGQFGHLVIPSFNKGNDLDQYLFLDSTIRQIAKADRENELKGWLVDLRNNTGGSMYPMIACILPLIEEDSLGYFLDKKGKTSWNSIFKKSKMAIQRVPKYKCKNLNLKIALLIDHKTASAAEMTAISLLGKSNVKLLGQKSKGLVTANRKFKLSNGSALILATSWCVDRNGKVYNDKLVPDIIEKDDKVLLETAINWLKK